MNDFLWPEVVRSAAESAFGGAIHNPKGRVHQMIDRRVRHAFGVWERRHAMNPEQHEYAGEVLAAAINKARSSSLGKPFPYLSKAVAAELERVVNHERVHEGFKNRAELVDVTRMLQEAVK